MNKKAVLSATTIIWIWCMFIVLSSSAKESTTLSLPNPPTNELTIHHTTEMNGYLEPCGCFKPMIGGMLRRATYLNKAPGSLRLDNGDLTLAENRQAEIKVETLIDFYNMLNYTAINLGENDYKLGLGYLQSLQQSFKGKLLSANVKDASGKQPFESVIYENRVIAGKAVTIGIVGVLSEMYAETLTAYAPELMIEPAEETLSRLEPELKSKSQFAVLLFHGPISQAEQLARRFDWINLLVYAEGADAASPSLKAGSTLMVNSGVKGKYIGVVKAGWTESGVFSVKSDKSVMLSPEFKDDPQALKLRKAYQARVKAEDLVSKVPKAPTPNGAEYVGSLACKECHTEEYAIWSKTKHAGAMPTLVKTGHESDPECVGCHVIGYEYQSGFQRLDKTPKLRNVGCESCHGAGSKHINDGEEMVKANSKTCTNSCHVPDHSPYFDYPKYWKKIKH